MTILNQIKKIILTIFIFIFPVFFLPLTSEYYSTGKFYLLALLSLLLILINVIEILIKKKVHLTGGKLSLPLVFFMLAIALSTIFSSVNKLQALLSLNFGLVPVLFSFVFYLFVVRAEEETKSLLDKVLLYSSSLISLVTLIFFFNPLGAVSLPSSWQFIKTPFFTPMGTFTDLTVFLAFSILYRALRKKFSTADVVLLAINVCALGVAVFTLFKPNAIVLPSFRLSWYAALEVLKNPFGAVIGAGIDNFSVVFTRVKDVLYNQSPLWQLNSFVVSRSAFLHVLTVAGLFGLGTMIFLIYSGFKVSLSQENKQMVWLMVFWSLVLLAFPISFTTVFVFLLSMALMDRSHHHREISLNESFPWYIPIAIFLLSVVAGSSILLSRTFTSEYYFKKSLDGLVANDAKQIYDNMRLARIYNPYNERAVLNFAQTNLIIANNLSQKKDLTENDRQTIARAIQSSISEAKELIKLNPNKAQYWENLANIYRSLIPLVDGADAWTISAYQRAIILDSQNPAYRMALGSVYYLLQKYPDATSFFEQAVALKPDWANGYYNLAWTYYQNKEYEKATLSMKNVLNLIDKNNSPDDWEKANADLEQFKKQLPGQEETTATESGEQLNLPTPAVQEIDPKIELPEEASPEAN